MKDDCIGMAMMAILEDKSALACDRLEAARVLLALGGWEPAPEVDEVEDHKVFDLMEASRSLVNALIDDGVSFPAYPADIRRRMTDVEAAILALEDDE